MKIFNKKIIKNKKCLTICPTRQRLQKCSEMLASFQRRTSKNTEIIFCLDHDDPELTKYKSLFGDKWAYIVSDVHKTITEYFNYVVSEFADYQYYFMANDDVVFHTLAWDMTLMDVIKKNGGWGISYARDGFQDKNLCTFPMISSNIIKTLRWLQMPKLTCLYGDNVWMTIGKGLGRLYFESHIYIEHKHHSTKKVEADEIAKKTNSQYMYQIDNKAFQDWFKSQSKSDISKIVKAIHKEAEFKKTVSLCMIVSDKENPADLKRCIDSCKDWIDEINVVYNYKYFKKRKVPYWHRPNGSPLSFSAINSLQGKSCNNNVNVQYLKWTNFSNMRNKSLKMATGKYILWLDADDMVDNAWVIKDAIFKNPEADAFKCHINSLTDRRTSEIIFHPRIFKNGKGYEFRNKCHEDVYYSIKEKGGQSILCDLIIHHLGNQNIEHLQKKNDRNLKLLLEDLHSPNAHNLTYYGIVNAYMIKGRKKDYITALKLIDEWLKKFTLGKDDPITGKVWVLRGICCMQCKQLEAAKQSLKKAWHEYNHPEGGANLAECLIQEQNFEKAIKILEEIHQGTFNVGSTPFDAKNLTLIVLHKLGFCYERRYESIVKYISTIQGVKDKQKQALMITEADQRAKDVLLKAESCYNECLQHDNRNLQVADRLAHIYRIKGQMNTANAITITMVNLFANYAVGWKNLGQFEAINQRYNSARLFYQEALRLNPKDNETMHNLKNIKMMIEDKK